MKRIKTTAENRKRVDYVYIYIWYRRRVYFCQRGIIILSSFAFAGQVRGSTTHIFPPKMNRSCTRRENYHDGAVYIYHPVATRNGRAASAYTVGPFLRLYSRRGGPPSHRHRRPIVTSPNSIRSCKSCSGLVRGIFPPLSPPRAITPRSVRFVCRFCARRKNSSANILSFFFGGKLSLARSR